MLVKAGGEAQKAFDWILGDAAEARRAIRKMPDHRADIIELYRLAMDEIEDGESEAHEYELFMGSLDEMRKSAVDGSENHLN